MPGTMVFALKTSDSTRIQVSLKTMGTLASEMHPIYEKENGNKKRAILNNLKGFFINLTAIFS